MKKILALLFLISFQSFAQNKPMPGDWDYEQPENMPFDPRGQGNTYGIKAKLLPYFIVNEAGIYSSIGTEIGIFKNQSITVEWFFNYKQHSLDGVTDNNGVEHETGNRDHMNDNALQIGYRYYYSLQKWRKDCRLAFYNGLFGRAEQDKIYFDKNFDDNPYINKTFNVRAVGITTGMIQRFKNSEHFGMDYNFSLGKSYTKTETYDGGSTSKEKHDSFYFNLGVSINYWF